MRSTIKTMLAVASLGLLAQGQAMADNVPILNWNFASPDAVTVPPYTTYTDNVGPYDWTVAHSRGHAANDGTYDWGVQSASNLVPGTPGQAAFLNNLPGSTASFSQELTAKVKASTTYTLTVDVACGSTTGMPNYDVLLIGAGGEQLPITKSALPSPGFGTWGQAQKQYTTGAAMADSLITIVLYADGSHGGQQIDFANVKLDATPNQYQSVPEATTLILGGVALMPLMLQRRRGPTRTVD